MRVWARHEMSGCMTKHRTRLASRSKFWNAKLIDVIAPRQSTTLETDDFFADSVKASSNPIHTTMPAPTALQRRPDELADDVAMHTLPGDEPTEATDLIDMNAVADEILPDTNHTAADDTAMVDESGRPQFAPSKSIPLAFRRETRKVPIPPHRMTPLKSAWPKIYVRTPVYTALGPVLTMLQPPLVEHLHLQVRMNIKTRSVELRTSSLTTSTDALQKGEDFVKAFTLGFDVDDAIALLRLDDLYIETFEIKDVKTLQGEHMGRAIGRIAGKDGKTKFAIENASRTRVVLADQKIHILGGFKNIHVARESIVSLILGQNPSKVYGNLRTVAGRMKERF
jgi:RNA-binding protein PNO1